MKNILVWIKKLINRNVDKLLHFSFSYMIMYTISDHWNVYAGIAITILVGVGKEILDQYTDKNFSWGDMVADIAGIVAALIFVL